MKWLLTLFVIFSSSVVLAKWDLNDVSYLMPLPKENLERSNLLGLGASGAQGELLPTSLTQQIPGLSFFLSRAEEEKVLRVVSVRIDPCFERPVPYPCEKQIRMVWQPVIQNPFGIVAVDAALHSFYTLSDAQFESLLIEVKQWKTRFEVNVQGKPLQIHPVLATNPEALKSFTDLILKYAGQKTLSRVTAMVLRGTDNTWAFAEYKVNGDTLDMQFIPRLDRKSQAYINQITPDEERFTQGGMAPAPVDRDNVNYSVADTDFFIQNADEETIRNEYRSSLAIQNPKKYSAATMDCVSCHVAQNATTWLSKTYPELSNSVNLAADKYHNPSYDLTNLSRQKNNFLIIRAFGYYGSEPAISQRVINESAEVADSLNRFF